MAEDNSIASQVYTSAQIAEELGIQPSTLRSWKSRKPDQLQEGIHWFQDGNTTFWTEEGFKVLAQLKDSVAPSTAATDSVADDATDSVAPSNPVQRYEGIVEVLADAITPQLLQRLDVAVISRIKASISTKKTQQECVDILTDFGLAPVNPKNLLNSRNVAGYLGEQSTQQQETNQWD